MKKRIVFSSINAALCLGLVIWLAFSHYTGTLDPKVRIIGALCLFVFLFSVCAIFAKQKHRKCIFMAIRISATALLLFSALQTPWLFFFNVHSTKPFTLLLVLFVPILIYLFSLLLINNIQKTCRGLICWISLSSLFTLIPLYAVVFAFSTYLVSASININGTLNFNSFGLWVWCILSPLVYVLGAILMSLYPLNKDNITKNNITKIRNPLLKPILQKKLEKERKYVLSILCFMIPYSIFSIIVAIHFKFFEWFTLFHALFVALISTVLAIFSLSKKDNLEAILNGKIDKNKENKPETENKKTDKGYEIYLPNFK